MQMSCPAFEGHGKIWAKALRPGCIALHPENVSQVTGFVLGTSHQLEPINM